MHTGLLSDDVWRQLDPRAARLTRRGRRGVVIVVAGITLLAAVVGLGLRSGLIAPRVTATPVDLALYPATHSYVERVRFTSSGWIDQHVSSAYIRTAGIDGQLRPGSFTIPHAGSITVRVTVYVRDCARATTDEAPLHLSARRFWGDMAFTLRARPAFEGATPHGPAWAVCHGQRH